MFRGLTRQEQSALIILLVVVVIGLGIFNYQKAKEEKVIWLESEEGETAALQVENPKSNTISLKSRLVNINTASNKVLDIIAGDEFEFIGSKIVAYRNGDDDLPGTEDDKIFTSLDTIVAQLATAMTFDLVEQKRIGELIKAEYFKVISGTFRVVSRGEVRGGRATKTIEAVVSRAEDDAQILYYHED